MTEPSVPNPLPYVQHHEPELDSPVLVVALDGWIDAGLGASTAMAALKEQLQPRLVATFDPDVFIDYRARRPVMHLRDGVNTAITWPSIELFSAQDPTGKDVLLLAGHEPDSEWRRFVDVTTALAIGLGTRLMVGLGAYPIAVPHTRPSLLSVSASTSALVERLGYLHNSLDVPAGVQAAIERAFADKGLPSIGLWAQVAHYASAMPYPMASLALVEGLSSVADLTLSTESLQEAAEAQRMRIDELVANNPENVGLVRQLEAQWDTEVSRMTPGGNLPSGDQLAAELERFLRDQGR
jgi:predicted ATP-grasp superfamily ATP-dependent carboligase